MFCVMTPQKIGLETSRQFVMCNRTGILLVDGSAKNFALTSDSALESHHPKLKWKSLPGVPLGTIKLNSVSFGIYCNGGSAGMAIVGKTNQFIPMPSKLKDKIQQVTLQGMWINGSEISCSFSKGGDSDPIRLFLDGSKWSTTSISKAKAIGDDDMPDEAIYGPHKSEIGRRLVWNRHSVVLSYQNFPEAKHWVRRIQSEDPTVLAICFGKDDDHQYLMVVDRAGRQRTYSVDSDRLYWPELAVLLRDGKLLSDGLDLRITRLR